MFERNIEICICEDETNDEFIEQVIELIAERYKAKFDKPTSLGPVGSQEFVFINFKIEQKELSLFSETYMGWNLKGPKSLVKEIEEIIKKHD